jgi:hypothetical protein
MPVLSTKNYVAHPVQMTHYNKPVTWYNVECLKCGSYSPYYRTEAAVINGRQSHKCPPHRGYLVQPVKIVADGATWLTRLRVKPGDLVWCPYWYADKIGTVNALTSDYTGPVKAVTKLAAYWP